MSPLKTWIFPAVLLIGAAVGILLLWPRDVKPPTMEQAQLRPVPPAPVAPLTEADRFDVRNRYGEFSFEKRTEGWMMTRPFLARANQTMLHGLFERLGKLEFGIVVSRDPKSQEQEKVGGKLAVEISLHRGPQPLWHFYLGKSAEFTLFRMEKSLDIWQLRGALRQQFVRDAAGWIEPQLIGEKKDQLRGITYLRGDSTVFAKLRMEPPDTLTLADGQEAPKTWHPSRVRRSLARLFQARLHAVEADPGKIREAFSVVDGGVELEFASGKALRLTFAAGAGPLTAVRVEERAPGGGKFQEYHYVVTVHSNLLRETLLKRPVDLEDPLVFATAAEAVTAVRGQCEKFTYGIVRDEKLNFVVKAGSQTFALAKSSMEDFLGFLSKGLLSAAVVLESQEVPDGLAVNAESDFVELDTLADGKKSTVRVSWGPLGPVDNAGIRYHFVTVSTRPGLVFQVMDRKILPICRTKLTWQLQVSDPENIPVPGQRRPSKGDPEHDPTS
jgi:hypothetical protein